MSKYKTIFVDTQVDKKNYEPNGDQLARDIQAAIVEKTAEGYELESSFPIQKMLLQAITLTAGVVLIFKKEA